MREVPTVTSNNSDIEVESVDYRQGFFSRGDWYVTWRHRRRPWEQKVMRLPISELTGHANVGQQVVEYRVHWRWEAESTGAALG